MEKELQAFCTNMRNLRKVRGMTQKEMAQALHISIGYVRRIEQGDVPIGLTCDVFYYIHRVFGVYPSQVVSEHFEPAQVQQK